MPKLQPNLPSTSFTADEIDAALGESFPKKASNNPRTSENLLKARDALAPGKIRFLDNANEAAKTGALPSDTAMRFSLAKTYEIEERKKQCLPPKKPRDRYQPINIKKFSIDDGNNRGSVKHLVKANGEIIEGHRNKNGLDPDILSENYFGNIRANREHYKALYEE
ncbi:hypothetical protein [Paraburkholderia humisilvae]|uniref:Uncharacterized protein n=1 Tax=Paraburkholderia humisilvae TaxID=627669 RepID=A0A6J5F6H7_9BURK|nr:hypothetical protein [Paraburkholderia humisilvae]CAB3773973.1 hypothetical protein LMG29542_07540 [Paraburkholderia humisilvae]